MRPSPRGRAADPEARLRDGLARLGLPLAEPAIAQWLRYVEELGRWNAAYNLTAVREPAEMVTRHLLDSLVLLPYLGEAGSLLDVGSGAGLPGLVLAIARPELAVTVLDASGKKARFLRHAVRTLALGGVTVVESRMERWTAPRPFDAITSRAFAALAEFVTLTDAPLAPEGRWLAMKGRIDPAELHALPERVQVRQVWPLEVPGLDETRHLVELVRRPP